MNGIPVPDYLVPDFRGTAYPWDYELMFTLIFAVWGGYLWKVAKQPKQYDLFIQFSIFATLAHIVGMLMVGLVHAEDLPHMIKDAVAMGIPFVFVTYFYYRKGENML